MHWRRKWQPTPVFLPGESQGWGSLVGCHLWGRTELDTTEATYQQQQQPNPRHVSKPNQEDKTTRPLLSTKVHIVKAMVFPVVVLQLLNLLQLFATPWNAAHQASLFLTISRSLLKFMSIESVMASHRLILCHLLIPPPSIVPYIRVFSSESALCIRWPRYWSFSFSISPSKNTQD